MNEGDGMNSHNFSSAMDVSSDYVSSVNVDSVGFCRRVERRLLHGKVGFAQPLGYACRRVSSKCASS
jgi:hypothetical protein